MRRRHLLPEAVILVLLGLLGWLLVSDLLHRGPRLGVPSKANFDRVEEGMTASEVQTLLGQDGHHAKRPVVVPMEGVTARRWWVEDDAVITITFFPAAATIPETPFEEWKVASKSYETLPPETFEECLCRWLRW